MNYGDALQALTKHYQESLSAAAGAAAARYGLNNKAAEMAWEEAKMHLREAPPRASDAALAAIIDRVFARASRYVAKQHKHVVRAVREERWPASPWDWYLEWLWGR